MIHTFKGFSIINETELDVFPEFLCFLCYPANVGNLISASSSLSKSILDIWKFLVCVMSKPRMQDLSMTLLAREISAIVRWLEHSLVLPFLGIGMRIDLFQSCGHCWVFQICWRIECNTWKESYDQPRRHIEKQRHYFVNKGPSTQGYAFSSGHVWIWELNYKESWMPKNWCFWTVVLEKTLESPLDCKEIQPVHPKGDQSWVFIGRTDAEAETPILWPPDGKNWLIGKDPDAGKDWKQKEKWTTEDEMAGWHYQLNGHEFEWTPVGGDG